MKTEHVAKVKIHFFQTYISLKLLFVKSAKLKLLAQKKKKKKKEKIIDVSFI